jgi:type II secretory pathway component PulK
MCTDVQKKKVLRKKGVDDEDMADLAKTTAELEAAAELAGSSTADRGSRALRESLAAKEAAQAADKVAERTAR